MLVETDYDRKAAVAYAKKWAFSRNPKYLNFEHLGGDCTNFSSQCLYAGSGVMNFTPLLGWYYRTSSDRTPSWTGVEYLYNFLIGNTIEKCGAIYILRKDIVRNKIIWYFLNGKV